MDKNKAAQELGRLSAKKRHSTMTPAEIKEYYNNLRLKRKDINGQNRG